MQADFWHNLWAENDIGFHENAANDLLVAHFGALGLASGARVLVPLCGKTRDIAWLLSRGYHVIGVELIKSAIEQLFADLNVDPDIKQIADFTRYTAPMIDILVGDIFELTADQVGQIDAVYDRAALVALPDQMRRDYAQLIQHVTLASPQLVVCFEYADAAMSGPPFSIPPTMLTQLYGAGYKMTERAYRDAQIRGVPAVEKAWHLTPVG